MSRNYELPSIACKPAKMENETRSWSNDLVVKAPDTKPDDRRSIPRKSSSKLCPDLHTCAPDLSWPLHMRQILRFLMFKKISKRKSLDSQEIQRSDTIIKSGINKLILFTTWHKKVRNRPGDTTRSTEVRLAHGVLGLHRFIITHIPMIPNTIKKET